MTAAPIADRTRGIGITTEVVDGMDVRAMASAAETALAAVRSGTGPWFLEAETYRSPPHSRSDPVTYQPEDEVERWRSRDPLDQKRAGCSTRACPRPSSTGRSGAVEAEIAEAIRLLTTTRSRIPRRSSVPDFA